MKKVFSKVLAVVLTTALVVGLGVGFYVTKEAKGDSAVTLGKWGFEQGGQYSPTEEGNEGYIGSVTMNGTSETIGGWLTGPGSVEQTQYAQQLSNGFNLKINNTGWDAVWGTDPLQFNPWSVMAFMNTKMEAGHMYKVAFKARASKKKYLYTSFETVVDDVTMTPYDQAGLRVGDNLQVITTSDQTFTYEFTNWVSGQNLKTIFMLGAFNGKYDYAGADRSDKITELETKWSGNVYISEFQIIDQGVDPGFVPQPTDPPGPTTKAPQPVTTKAPAPVPTTKVTPVAKKLAKVTKVKVKNPKKKTIKVTWKKVKYAKKYQIKVGSKTYTSKKTSKTIKNKKFKKKKKVSVKVRATAPGYKAGPWSKVVKKKLKK